VRQNGFLSFRDSFSIHHSCRILDMHQLENKLCTGLCNNTRWTGGQGQVSDSMSEAGDVTHGRGGLRAVPGSFVSSQSVSFIARTAVQSLTGINFVAHVS
jgi:hypothetical protein